MLKLEAIPKILNKTDCQMLQDKNLELIRNKKGNNGGLKMIDPFSFCRYLKLTSVKTLIISDGRWQNVTTVFLCEFGSDDISHLKTTVSENSYVYS